MARRQIPDMGCHVGQHCCWFVPACDILIRILNAEWFLLKDIVVSELMTVEFNVCVCIMLCSQSTWWHVHTAVVNTDVTRSVTWVSVLPGTAPGAMCGIPSKRQASSVVVMTATAVAHLSSFMQTSACIFPDMWTTTTTPVTLLPG